jgi:myo-inositol-1(or 4)-monophosphatase
VSTLSDWAGVVARHLREVANAMVLPTLGDQEGEEHWATSTQVHTIHDARCGAELERRFAASFPGHGLVVEDRESTPGDGVHEWYIDPIDGSANHLRGIPYVSLTAGLLRDGEPVVGVVHDVMRDTTLVAWSGGGAWRLRGGTTEPLVLDTSRRLEDAIAVVHVARLGPLLGRDGALAHLLWRVRKMRCMGSIALDLGMVASGESDMLVAGRGRPQRLLDILGGLIVLREAGGVALTAEGKPLDWDSRTLIAGPEPMCQQLVEAMAEFDLEGWRAEQAAQPVRPAP